MMLIKVEPYWNVNVLGAIRAGLPLYIKVEPYWNVNLYFIKGFEGSPLH